MCKNFIFLISFVMLLSLAGVVQAESFSIGAASDVTVCNDEQVGPDSNYNGTGLHIRDLDVRRRVSYISYDISELKAEGKSLANVIFNIRGKDSDSANLYGLLEDLDALDVESFTWNTAPGVQNDPTPPVGDPVALDHNDLTDLIMVVSWPDGARESTDPCQALDDFINSDTDGILTFVFAPRGTEGVIYSSEDSSGGTFLEGDLMEQPQFATNPIPADAERDAPYKVVLSWTPGAYATESPKHRIYFSEDFNDVNDGNDVAKLAEQDPNYYPAGETLDLDFSQAYYWRVDEANATTSWDIGKVWLFTVEPYAYQLPSDSIDASASSYTTGRGPENTINESGMNTADEHSTVTADMWQSGAESPGNAWIEYEFDKPYKLHQMWVWNYNGEYPLTWYGCNEVVIQYSTDGDSYTTLGTTHIFNEATGEPNYVHNITIDFEGKAAKYVRITANSNHSSGAFSQYGLSEVRFYYIPMSAREPHPEDEETGVSPDVTLRWRAGREAAQHKLYISTDEQAVIDETVTPNTIPASGCYGSYGPLSLDLDSIYYWKVNEVNSVETPGTWQGDVWQFSTPEYLVVDNMDDYGDANTPGELGSRIYYVWRDGWDVTNPPLPGNDTGSQVYHWNGEGTDFMESTIVRSGVSMPFYYENDGETESKPIGGYHNSDLDYYSEATASTSDLPIGSNWTKGGVKALVLWFYGDPNNDANSTEQMYVKLNGLKVPYDGDMSDIKEPFWHEWNIDLADFGTDLNNVTSLSIGFGNDDENAGGAGIVYFDDIRLYPPRCVPSLRSPVADFDNDCDVDYDDLQMMAADWLVQDIDEPAWEGTFSNQDIGETSVAGSFGVDGGVYSIEADGADIWGTADAFHYAYKQVSGDFQMTVRVLSIEATHEFAKAGIMVRQTLDADSSNVLIAAAALSSTWSNAGSTFQWRSTAGGTSSSSRTLTGYEMPGCIRLVRKGNTFTGHLFLDGKWQQQGNAATITMTDPVYLGLAATSHVDGTLTTATFDRDCIFSGADFYDDGIINFRDFAFMAEEWLELQLWP